MTYLLFGTALTLSGVAEFYAIMGLIAIFAGAPISIAIMGVTLGVAKLTITSWLYRYWNKTSLIIKTYFIIAIVILMSLTSMGIFGYLSKAHLDQGASTGDAQAKVQIYDDKIKTAKENIDANRKVLKQMDEAVDQVMGRSTSETGADKAVAIRRSQQKERARIASEIATEQKAISQLSEERAPIAAEVRKVEAEVGPIKYIAALLYGDNLDSNMLESAVRIMIIMIVVVFDPLAVLMFIAYNQTITQKPEEKPQIQVVKEQPIQDGVPGNDLEFEAAVRADDQITIEKW
jgi:hypothetical protein